jgi:tape measure domain-containing protein
MALTPVGVQFVSADFTKFLNNMSKAALAIANLGNMTKNRLAAIESFAKALTKVNDSAQKMANANAKIVTSNNQVTLSNNKLATSTNQVAIANSKATTALVSASISHDKLATSSNKAATELQRLDLIQQLTDMLAVGAVTADQYAVALLGINNRSNQLSKSIPKIVDSVKESNAGLAKAGQVVTGFGAILERTFGGIFKGISSAAAMGGMIGGVLGTLAGPGVGNALGGFLGSLVGAVVQLTINFEKALFNLYKSIATAIVTFLPKTIAAIVNSGVKIVEALYGFGKTIVTSAWNVIKTITSPITNIFKSILGMFSGGQGGFRGLGDSLFGAMFKFEILKQTIRGVINEIKSLATAALGAAGDIQTLTARLNFLIASQAMAANEGMDFANAMKVATPVTQDLLKWIQKLSLASPVSVDDISKTVSLSLAMGWTSESAKTLTKSIVDYTSALGMGSEISERIIYNFAQMRQQGKVTGTELRDLGRGAYMPITKILNMMWKELDLVRDGMDSTTISFQDFRDQAAAGTIDVEKFFTAFNEFVKVNLPDAAYKMNFTFAAVKDNLQDLFKIILGWNVLGPVIKSLTKPLQDFIERFQSDEVLLGAKRIGIALSFMVEGVKKGIGAVSGSIGRLFTAAGLALPSIENVVKTIVKFGLAIEYVGNMIARFIDKYISPFASMIKAKFGDTFNTMNNDFFTWGANLILSFATGMMRSAAKVLVMAINYIGKILTSWFSTHSPPKILPDIGIWGMETINEWLHGFTQADFSVLDSLKGAIGDALGALVDFGVLTDVQSAQMYTDLYVKLIQAMDEFNRTGQISTDIFGELMTIGGVFGKEIAELLDLQLQLAVATEYAAKAQKDYDDAVKATQRSEVKTNKLIREYNTILRKGASKDILKNQLKIVNASQIELNANRKAEIVKKTALDLANEQLNVLEDQVKLQESLIKQMTDLAKSQKDALGGTAGAIEDIVDALDGLGADWAAGIPAIDWDLTTWMSEAQTDFDNWWAERTKSVGDLWYDLFNNPDSDFQKALDNIAPSIKRVTDAAIVIWDNFAKAINLPSWEEISSAWGNVPDIGYDPIKNLDPFGPGQGEGADTRALKIIPDWIGKIQAVLDVFAADIKENKGIIATLGLAAGYIWDNLYASLSKQLTDPQSSLRTGLSSLGNQLMTLIADVIAPVEVDIKGDKGRGKTLSPGTRILNKLAESIGTAIENAKPIIAGWGETIGGYLVDGVQKGVINTILSMVAKTWWGEILVKTLEYFMAKSPSALFRDEVGAPIVQGLYDGIVKYVTDKWETAKKGLQNFIDNVKKFFGIGEGQSIAESPFYLMGVSIVEGIVAGINSISSKIGELIRGIIPDWILKYIENGTTPTVRGTPKTIPDIKEPAGSFARGGFAKPWNQYLVGEKGPELFIPKTQGFILPNNILKSLSSLVSIPAPMSAAPVYGNTVNFNGDIQISNGMDWAVFKAQVQRALVEK